MVIGRVSFNTRQLMLRQNLARAQKRYSEISIPATTGKKINSLSDEPSLTYRLFNLKNKISAIETYELNIITSRHLQNTTDSKIDEAVTLVHRLREVAVGANNSVIDTQDRQNYVDLLDNINEEVLAIANYRVNGRYIFAGAKTDTIPFSEDPAMPAEPNPADAAAVAAYIAASPYEYNGNNTEMSIEVSFGVTSKVNIEGETLFMGRGGGVDVFNIIKNMKWAIDNEDESQLETEMDNLETLLDQFLVDRADVGVEMQRLDSAETLIQNEELRATKELSDLESADIAEIATELTVQEMAMRVIFQSSSRVLKSTFNSILGG